MYLYLCYITLINEFTLITSVRCTREFFLFIIITIYVCFFFTQAAAGLDLKENLAAGATWPYHSVYHPYDAAFGYPFNG